MGRAVRVVGGKRIVVVGQAARDLVLRMDHLPATGSSASVTERIERLGGKGANIAVGLGQLNPDVTPSLVAVLGEDNAGESASGDAVEFGLDVAHVVRRGRTALMVDLVTADGDRRLLEDIPAQSLLTPEDIARAADVFRHADIVVLQLQQPPGAIVAAGRLAYAAGAIVVLDGAVSGAAREELLDIATIVRADAHEASLLTGTEIDSRAAAARAAATLLGYGPALVALSVPGEGDLVAWQGGQYFYPHGEHRIVDPTGAGDAFLAGLVTGWRRSEDPREIGQLAADCAAVAVQRLGGHPDLSQLADQSNGENPRGSDEMGDR